MPDAPTDPPRPTGPPRAVPPGAVWPLLLLAVVLVALFVQSSGVAGGIEKLGYSEYQARVEAGEVGFARITDRAILLWNSGEAPPDEPPAYAVERPPIRDEDPTALLTQHGVEFDGKSPSPFSGLLTLVVLTVGLFALFGLMLRRNHPAERAMAFGRARTRQYVERHTKTTFADVAGIDEPKQELEEIVEYLRSPDKYRRLGGRIPRGVLLVGAPGTGKTLLAKAVAGEAQVPFFSLSGSDFVEMFVGVGASRVRDLFRQAEHASPCIVFIDELDALGKVRGGSITGGGHDEREQTLNQLLVEMDGFDSDLNVILMAATNRPEILDPALLRPGRFDRQVIIPRPDIAGREAILRVHIDRVQVAPSVDLHRVAARTPGFVGADLANVVNEAALLAARREREAVEFADFDEAIDRVSVGLERRSQVIGDEEKRITAVHEAGHAVVALFSGHADPVHKVSIIPRGFAEGYTLIVPERERHNLSEAELTARMAGLLGGREAELLELGQRTTGAAGDLQQVTRIARAMVCELGMSDAVGPLHYSEPRYDPWNPPSPATRPFSEETARQIDAEVQRLVRAAADQARSILSTHRDELRSVAERLLDVEVIDRDELYRLVGLDPPASPGGEVAT